MPTESCGLPVPSYMGWGQVLESQRRALEILQWPEKWQRWAMVAVSYGDDRKTKELAKTRLGQPLSPHHTEIKLQSEPHLGRRRCD